MTGAVKSFNEPEPVNSFKISVTSEPEVIWTVWVPGAAGNVCFHASYATTDENALRPKSSKA